MPNLILTIIKLNIILPLSGFLFGAEFAIVYCNLFEGIIYTFTGSLLIDALVMLLGLAGLYVFGKEWYQLRKTLIKITKDKE